MPILALLLASAAAQLAPSAVPPESLLRGPARCVLRYLDAVRRSGPLMPTARSSRPLPARAQDYERARLLTAPRALEAAERSVANGADHPLAPWRDAARGTVLESFQLLAVRRAPRGAAVVTVRERWWQARAAAAPLEQSVSEYLVARVDGEWRVVDRRPGGTFEDSAVEAGYAGWFDGPVQVAAGAGSERLERPERAARTAPIPARAWAPLRPPDRR